MLNSPNNTEQPAKILVMGLGGAGCNLVNRLAERPPVGVDLVLANTDAQALLSSRKGPRVIFLGEGATRGLGAGADHRLGSKAAEQSSARLEELFEGVDMVFLTAGMGGGTGTGAAPVAARAARKAGALVVAVVTQPFEFEGHRRVRVAREGVAALQDEVDTLLVLPNQKLLAMESGNCPLDESFNVVDQVLCDAVRGMTEIVTMPGVINLDFADVRAVLEGSGRAIFGMATAPTAQRAVELALSNPLVGGSPDGAAGCLLNITAGPDMTLQDYSAACALLQESASPEAMVLCGYVQDDSMMGRARATVVATRVVPAESVRKPNLASHQMHDEPMVRDNELLPLAQAALPHQELTAYERRQRQESAEISFAPSQRPPAPAAKVPAAASAPAPARAGLVRKGMTSGETEKKSKWMDLPAIWRRARRGESAGDSKASNEG
ncbi:MAG: cell division protein FtsZ [Candidatus Eremiobacteraeota bacterium]|nr:cell division protein FtsZ [Candidatus Eremiobacteraeota bacterium]